jgi:peptidoglycan/LPS O-acetylase OafA/YrhL
MIWDLQSQIRAELNGQMCVYDSSSHYDHLAYLFQGLRGLAAIFVACSHISLAYGGSIRTIPVAGEPSRWFQMPLLNLPLSGTPWINVFLVLTGLVNLAGPIKKSRSGDFHSALSGLSVSAFRRTLRLVLPCTIATFISWILCQLHAFEMGRSVDSNWMQSTSPAPSDSLSAAITSLFTAIWRTWNDADNYFDKNQWTMIQFLQGSFLLFLALLATIKAAPFRRNIIFGMLYGYYWFLYDSTHLNRSHTTSLIISQFE